MVVMVDAFVEKVVDMLISTLSREIETQVGLVVGVENQVEKLKNNLESIQAVLIDADKRQLKETSVQLWLDRLKEVTYDIDDVFDEWNVRILKSQIRKDEISQSTMKVWSFKFVSFCSCFPKVVTCHRIAIKINNLNERLDAIAIEKDRYGFQLLTANNEQVERDITTSVIDVSEVKGREVDREKLVKMLLTEGSHLLKLRLIPIVGMGGIGKTTLAKLVYHDEKVKSHFDKRIWICVSDPFDETKIAKEILESLAGSAPNLVSLTNMMEKLQESVQGKKILFVLDDVWNEDPRKWKQLGDCLKSSLPGSCILVTTRNENVGKTMGCFESDIYRIGLLSNEESWELFCVVAFSRKSSGERVSLEEIGRQVVSRCKGLPLALRTIAGLLQFKNFRTEWQDVLESKLWDLEEVRRDFLAPLWLSYYNLASPLKECFSYCAMFPKDYRMEKGKLIRSWMAQGYVKGKQLEDLEKIGDRYFQILAMRSLFQDVEVKEGGYGATQTWCKMHDLVHDFARSLVKKECLTIEVDVGLPISIDNSFRLSLRHLGIDFRGQIWCPDSFYSLKKLRSLHISRSKTGYPMPVELHLQKIFSKFTSLRSLRLFNCGIENIPSNISNLIHLRELDLSWNFSIRKLPDSLWELCNLQTLILVQCVDIESLKGLERLTNLRHIDSSGTNFVFPKEIAKLSGLRRLHEVGIYVDDRELFSLKHLKNLNQLGGSLVICWLKHCDGDIEDAKQAQMKDKKHITQLNLQLCVEETEGRIKQDEDLMEALMPPPNLQILKISSYMSSKPPSWMTFLTCLELIHLYHWRNTECLPALGKLSCLYDLRLEIFHSIEKVGPEFLGMDESESSNVPLFPKLRTLWFGHFYDWKEWEDVDEKIMPNLSALTLFDCPELKAFPNFILQKTGLKPKVISCRALEEFLIRRGLEYEGVTFRFQH